MKMSVQSRDNTNLLEQRKQTLEEFRRNLEPIRNNEKVTCVL
jgi:hypothetical protein